MDVRSVPCRNVSVLHSLAICSTRTRLGEEVPISVANGAAKASKAKAARNSTEQTAGDADDEQDRDKNIPILFEEAQVVWVKMSGHPW